MARLTPDERTAVAKQAATGATAAERNAARRRMHEDDCEFYEGLIPLHASAAAATNVVTIISPTRETEEEFVALRNAVVAQMAYLNGLHAMLSELMEEDEPYQEPEDVAATA